MTLLYPLDFLPKKISQALILFVIMGLTAVASLALAAEENPAFAPPWGKTRERIPQEVKDKENEQPLAWCENEEKQEFEVTYVDNNGTRTRIKRKVVMIDPPPGGTVRLSKIVWEITTDTPGQPRKKSTYDLEPGKETRTEKIGKNQPTTRPIREGDLFDPAAQPPAKKSFLPRFSTRLARVNFPASNPSLPLSREDSFRQELFILLAATQERPRPSAPSTQERPALNVKLVTYGQPLENPVVHLGEDPQTTPEEFVQKPTGTPWNPGDEEGPKTVIPGTTGIPITFIPSGGINIGSGWASTRVPARVLLNCSGDDVDEPTDVPTIVRVLRILRELEEFFTGYPHPQSKYTTTTRKNDDGSTTTTDTTTRENDDGTTTTTTSTTRMNDDGSTTRNPDGSITTTRTRTHKDRHGFETTVEWTTREYRDGTKIRYMTITDRDPDGATTTTIVRENRDGSSYTYRKYPDGFTRTIKKNPDGSWVEDSDGKITVHEPEEKPPPKR
jgi:hypothetical protein